MSRTFKMLAFDFGASSGRVILGKLEGKTLEIEEIHRFANEPVRIAGSLHWDVLRLFHEIKQGILKCVGNGYKDLDSMAIDTWGVDFGLLDEKGKLLGNPLHYRDSLTDGMPGEAFEIIPEYEIYKKTGIQIMKFNTAFQLLAMKNAASPQLKAAKTILLTPDLFNYFLTGVKSTEYCIASTTQLLDIESQTWCDDIIAKFGFDKSIFTEIVPPGTVIGRLLPEISRELGCGAIQVVTTASHDTQAAIVAVPALCNDFVYISCGTWSLMGVETDRHVVNDKSNRLNFTNEGGVANKTNFLKNIMGLWLVQECKRQWDREGEKLEYAELESVAWKAAPFKAFIDPEDESFMAPGDMPERIKTFCRNTSQPIPQGKGETVRCIAESLALKYRMTIESIEEIFGKRYDVIHMVGGGIKDKMLCQFTADATSRKVIAGPTEATSIGNIMVQAMALGAVKDLNEARQIVNKSFMNEIYTPHVDDAWSEAYERFRKLVK